MGKSNQDKPTPLSFVHAVEKLFNIRFSYDLAGTIENKKAPIVYTEEIDSLGVDWPTDGWCWLNPPFNNVGKWVKKCHIEMKKGARIISIWPLSGDLNQILTWQTANVYVIHGRVWLEVRSCMLCVWDDKAPCVYGISWDAKTSELKILWGDINEQKSI